MHKKHLTKIQHPFMTNTLNKPGIARNLHNMKTAFTRNTVNIILNGKRVKAFPVKSGTRKRKPTFITSI